MLEKKQSRISQQQHDPNDSDSNPSIAEYIDKSKRKAEKYSFKNARKQGINEGIEANLTFYSREELGMLKIEIERLLKEGFDQEEESDNSKKWRIKIGKKEYLTKLLKKVVSNMHRKDSNSKLD